MSNTSYHKNASNTGKSSKQVHSSLASSLQNIPLESLTPEDARRLLGQDANRVLGDFVRGIRSKGMLR